MHLYWASVFILPASIIHDIEQQLNSFLWCQGEIKRGKVKVKWDDVCLPKEEGGLGIRKLQEFNIALMAAHVYKLVTRKETLWVRWIHAYKLKKKSFWEVKLTANVSWSWRKLLQIRSLIRRFLCYRVCNGTSISAWFDSWHSYGPIVDVVPSRAIFNAGFDSSESLADVIQDGHWLWPVDWGSWFLVIQNTPVPFLIAGKMDKLCWKDSAGRMLPFSVSTAWNDVRSRSLIASWHKAVWSYFAIPRHCIHMWLICRRRLKTQDRLKQWDVGKDVDLTALRCLLCDAQQESHEHLFFECPYSMRVWKSMLSFAEIPFGGYQWDVIILWLLSLGQKNKIGPIISRLLVGATSYFIWQERNRRLHGKKARNEDTLVHIITDSIRLKLVSTKFKKKAKVGELMKTWKVPWHADSP